LDGRQLGVVHRFEWSSFVHPVPVPRWHEDCADLYEARKTACYRARCEAQMGRSDIYVKVHQLSDAQLIKLLQFQGDDDGEADGLSVMVEEEIERRKAGGGRFQ
jgi:hypothetical protein